MKFLENILEKAEKNFKKGAPLEFFYYLFEAKDTFLMSPKTTTRCAPHVRDDVDLKRVMVMVILSLIPCLIFGVYNTGFQSLMAADLINQKTHWHIFLEGLKIVLPLIIVSYAVGGIWEVLFSLIRRHEINEGFLVTGLLFPLICPPTLPLWQAALGISFGVVIGKEVFGGTGMNIFNPALTARCFLFFSYPAQMSGEVWTAISGGKAVDGFSGATALGVSSAIERGQSAVAHLTQAGYSWERLFFGLHSGSIGETSTAMCIVGALILIITGVGAWRTMVGCVVGAVATTSLFNVAFATSLGSTYQLKGIMSLPPHWHLVLGGFAFGAIFMSTDPVSSSATNTGKWIYGILIGSIAMIIRVINPAYPEGMMLAILFMNIFAPIIDHFVIQSRIKARRVRLAR